MVATTIEQSKELLRLGLDPKTADMFWMDTNGVKMSEQEMQMKLYAQQEKIKALKQEVVEMNKEREYWQQVRIQTSIEFAAQILANHGGTPASVANNAVDYADALIKKLKGGQDD